MLEFLFQFCHFPAVTLDIIVFSLTFLTCKMGMLSGGRCWERHLLSYIWSTWHGLELPFSYSQLRRFVLSCSVTMYRVWIWRKLRQVKEVQPSPSINEEAEVKAVKPFFPMSWHWRLDFLTSDGFMVWRFCWDHGSHSHTSVCEQDNGTK